MHPCTILQINPTRCTVLLSIVISLLYMFRATMCPLSGEITLSMRHWCRSQWPRGLRRRYAAARLLRSWVRIPPGAWMFVLCECCVLSGRGFCDELITRPEESYRLWCVVVCDLEKPREWGGHDPRWVAAPQPKKRVFVAIPVSHRYSNFSWWWAHGCPKHVEKRNN